ncbi:trypsin-like peptidase domain-containing protein [Carboxylicivirga sp. RSCT41]|uniref:trypsin-like peptidase domain-containing protein n=1 Tax=Carboxylicivirga agarovorans TaxID=3417570 RepID=UPI003D3437F7
MKTITLISISAMLLVACRNTPVKTQEDWIEQAVSSWPYFALTNEIRFQDTTFYDLANSFLVDTGHDTVGVSCKHLFMVFEDQLGLNTIDLGNSFIHWKMYPKNYKKRSVAVKSLINRNPNEQIGGFNTLKEHDWIVFELQDVANELYPLKIRYTPVKKNETVYAVGWGMNQTDNSQPAVIQLQCFSNTGNCFYTSTLNNGTHPQGRSGSPVIDRNGYLVGIVSGQEGNLAVIGGVNYLKRVFDKYGVRYEL